MVRSWKVCSFPENLFRVPWCRREMLHDNNAGREFGEGAGGELRGRAPRVSASLIGEFFSRKCERFLRRESTRHSGQNRQERTEEPLQVQRGRLFEEELEATLWGNDRVLLINLGG